MRRNPLANMNYHLINKHLPRIATIISSTVTGEGALYALRFNDLEM